MVVGILDATHMREYVVSGSDLALSFSAAMQDMQPFTIRKPRLLFNPFFRAITLYYITSDRRQLFSLTASCASPACFSQTLEFEPPTAALALFFLQDTQLSISRLSFATDNVMSDLKMMILLVNSLVQVRDLSQPWTPSGDYLQLPYRSGQKILPTLLSEGRNASSAFIAEGSKMIGTPNEPMKLAMGGVHLGRAPAEALLFPELGFQDASPPLFLPANTLGVHFSAGTSRIFQLPVLQAGQTYLFVTDSFSTAPLRRVRRRRVLFSAMEGAGPHLELGGQIFSLDGPSQINIFHPFFGQTRSVDLYSFTPVTTATYTLHTSAGAVGDPFLTELWAFFRDFDVPGHGSKQDEARVICCFVSSFSGIRASDTAQGFRLVTSAADGSLQVWKPDSGRPLERLMLDSSDAGKEVLFVEYTSEAFGARVVSFAKGESGLKVWAVVETADPVFTDLIVLLFNATVYLAVVAFALVMQRWTPRYEAREQKRATTSWFRSFLAAIGIRRSFRKFNTMQLEGYAPSILCCGCVETNRFLLTLYLLFVLVFFTPGLLFSFAESTDGGASCALPQNKLSAIQHETLKDLRFFESLVEVEEAEREIAALEERIEQIRVSSGNGMFTNYPNGSADLCVDSIREEYEEVQRKLTSLCEARVFCLDEFVGLDLSFGTMATWFFERNNNILIKTVRRCLPPPGTL